VHFRDSLPVFMAKEVFQKNFNAEGQFVNIRKTSGLKPVNIKIHDIAFSPTQGGEGFKTVLKVLHGSPRLKGLLGFQKNGKGDHMKAFINFNGFTHFPMIHLPFAVQYFFYFRRQASDIDHGMADENIRQTVGEATLQALARTLGQFKVKLQPVTILFFKRQTNVISPFLRVPEEGIEKLIRSGFRKNAAYPVFIK
jgi:hypothetical protein